jgi:hypothetical protein
MLSHHAKFISVQQAVFPLAQVLMPSQDLEASSQFPQAVNVYVHWHGDGRRRMMLLASMVVTMTMVMMKPLPETATALLVP